MIKVFKLIRLTLWITIMMNWEIFLHLTDSTWIEKTLQRRLIVQKYLSSNMTIRTYKILIRSDNNR